jgi:uncharacterized membrane protein
VEPNNGTIRVGLSENEKGETGMNHAKLTLLFKIIWRHVFKQGDQRDFQRGKNTREDRHRAESINACATEV